MTLAALTQTLSQLEYDGRKPVLAKCLGIVDTMAQSRNSGCRYQFTPTVYYLKPRHIDKLPIWRLAYRLEPQWNYDTAKQLAMEHIARNDNILFLPYVRNNCQISPEYTPFLPFTAIQVSARRFVVLNTYREYDALVSWITMIAQINAPAKAVVDSTPRYAPFPRFGYGLASGPEDIQYLAECGCQRCGERKQSNQLPQDTYVMMCSKHYKLFSAAEE